jgi:MFS family permease
VGETGQRAGGKGIGASALLVFGAMLPATIVIPVVRRFVEAGWPGTEWLMHAFIAVNLLGACLGGPLIAVQAERASRRRLVAAVSATLDGALLLAAVAMPPLGVLLLVRFLQGAFYIAAVSILMGSIRRAAKTSGAMGLVGGAVVLSILLGIPLGAILGKVSVTLPLVVGGLVGVATGLLTPLLLPAHADAEQSTVTFRELVRAPLLRGPTVVVALERFAVGSFVVTLQLYGHVRGVPDHRVSAWFSVFLFVFALTTWPFARLGDRVDRWRLVAAGALVYGASFFALPLVPVGALWGVLTVGGLASAAIYGPSLGLAAAAVPAQSRASAMAVLNAAGTLGMFLGSTLAGVLSGGLIAGGVERATAYGLVFAVAGLAQLGSVAMALAPARGVPAVVSAD